MRQRLGLRQCSGAFARQPPRREAQNSGGWYVFSVGSARASRAVFGALAEHTVRSAARRPVQPRRLRSPYAE